jgi:DNA-binding XRE family transcriptional regulator
VGYKHRQYTNRLKITRQNSGFSQQQVAQWLGHSNVISLSNWENAIYMPSAANLVKLCMLYGKSFKDLYPDMHAQIERQIIEL